MPRHISILSPGQGSQHIGMLDNLPVELVESFRGLALEALSFDLIDLIKNGNKEDLNKTSITQPAILLTSFIHYKHLQNSINFKADLMCGHSLGEYSALVASNSITLDDGLKLVYQRGLLMERSLKGSMYAILNTDIDIINELCMKVRDDGLLVKEGAAWTKKSGQNKEGGLNEKGRKSYEKENPGSDLKAPTKKKGNKRRASFCARMKGMKKKLTSKKTASDPDSRINKSLRKWDC